MMTDNQFLAVVVAIECPFVGMLVWDAYALIRDRRRRGRTEDCAVRKD